MFERFESAAPDAAYYRHLMRLRHKFDAVSERLKHFFVPEITRLAELAASRQDAFSEEYAAGDIGDVFGFVRRTCPEECGNLLRQFERMGGTVETFECLLEAACDMHLPLPYMSVNDNRPSVPSPY